MSLYHVHADIIGRSGGKDATASIAYQTCSKVEDRTTGLIYNYQPKKNDLIKAVRFLPSEYPEWAKIQNKDFGEFWNRVQEKENRKNSQFARDIDLAFQKELSLDDNFECLKKWVQTNWTNRGLVADVCVHNEHKHKDGTTNDNIHAHVMVATRKVNNDGWTEKDREANDREFYKATRKSWADIVNAKFIEKGINEHIDERTYEEQGIDKVPQQHLGATAIDMQRKGKQTKKQKYPDVKTLSDKEQDKVQNLRELKNIEVTEKELQIELEKDNQYQELIAEIETIKTEKNKKALTEEYAIKHATRIYQMNPMEWKEYIKGANEYEINRELQPHAKGEYRQMLDKAKAQSEMMWIRQNKEPIVKFYKDWIKQEEENQNTKNIDRPTLADKPLLSSFYTWKDDNNRVHKKYEDYKQAQTQIITKWEKEYNEKENHIDQLRHDHNDMVKENIPKARINIAQRCKGLWEQVKKGGQDLFRTAKEFLEVRIIKKVVEELKPEKDAQLEQYEKQQRAMRNNRNRDTGYSR